MFFIDHSHLTVLNGQLENRDYFVRHKLSGDRSADEIGKFLGTARDVLLGLNCAKLIAASFGLDGYDKLSSLAINADINLVDFNLPNAFDGCAKVILHRVAGDAEEQVNQSVVPNFGK